MPSPTQRPGTVLPPAPDSTDRPPGTHKLVPIWGHVATAWLAGWVVVFLLVATNRLTVPAAFSAAGDWAVLVMLLIQARNTVAMKLRWDQWEPYGSPHLPYLIGRWMPFFLLVAGLAVGVFFWKAPP